MALSVRILANIGGQEIPWENVPKEQKRQIATKLNDDAMKAAGYIKKHKEILAN